MEPIIEFNVDNSLHTIDSIISFLDIQNLAIANLAEPGFYDSLDIYHKDTLSSTAIHAGSLNLSNNEIKYWYLKSVQNHLGKNTFYAPYNNNDMVEVQKLHSSISANCTAINNQEAGSDCKSQSYKVYGFNTYYINSIDSLDTIQLFLSKTNCTIQVIIPSQYITEP